MDKLGPLRILAVTSDPSATRCAGRIVRARRRAYHTVTLSMPAVFVEATSPTSQVPS